MAVEFPRALLRERSHAWNLLGVAQTPGQTAATAANIVRSDGGGFWSCMMADVSLSGRKGLDLGRDRQRNATLLWRAVRQYCDGGVRTIVVPRNDALFRPWPAGLAQGVSSVPHDDGALFGGDVGYYQSVIDVEVASAAALRAVALDVAINYAGELIGGESFSIEHPSMGWRLYEIATVESDDADAASITFLPPLREAVTIGTALEFDRPRCTMRLSTPKSMDLTVAPWTFNNASVDFVEAFL